MAPTSSRRNGETVCVVEAAEGFTARLPVFVVDGGDPEFPVGDGGVSLSPSGAKLGETGNGPVEPEISNIYILCIIYIYYVLRSTI